MDKRVMEDIRTLVCDELKQVSQTKGLNGDSADFLKDLLKINRMLEEDEMQEMEMDKGYSQRAMRGVYYIDGDYSNAGRNSYDRGEMMPGNSYGYRNYYDRYQEYPKWNDWGNSRTGNPKEDMVHELKAMADKTEDTQVKAAIFEALGKIEGK